VLGGIGFGFFIDELGKYITSDNNYFFKPAAGVIYIVFVGLFLVSRQVQRRRRLSEADLLRNAIERIGGATHGNFDAEDRARALEMLDGVEQSNPMVGPLRDLVERLEAAPVAAQSRISLLGHEIRHRFLALTRKHWFERAIVIFFAIWATVIMLNLLTLVLALADGSEFESAQLNESGTFLAIAIVSSAAVTASFVLTGLLRIRRGQHQAGYEWLARGLLVSILVTQVFLFVQSQFGAVFGLGVDILLLVTVRAMGAEDRQTALVPERA
jgi:hypothetical protein